VNHGAVGLDYEVCFASAGIITFQTFFFHNLPKLKRLMRASDPTLEEPLVSSILYMASCAAGSLVLYVAPECRR
jgi:hypothetical protein